MADTADREVALELGGERYVLRVEYDVIIRIEDALGTNLFDIGRRIEVAQVSAMELIDFAHACIVEAGYEVTRERLAELIVEAGAGAAVGPLNEFCQVYVFGARSELGGKDAGAEVSIMPDTHPDLE